MLVSNLSPFSTELILPCFHDNLMYGGLMHELCVAVIARDKFSRAIDSVRSLVGKLPHDSHIYVFDSGYPKDIINEIICVCNNHGLPLSFVEVERFANTNLVWNQFVGIADSRFLMCLENDVIVSNGCIASAISLIDTGRYDIAVPVVFENTLDDVEIPHFNPQTSDIIELSGNRIRSILDRGRTNNVHIPLPRIVKHLERHCFIISSQAASKLGKLDIEMYCRTDYDMSIQCFKAGLVIGIPENGHVVFTQYPKGIEIDRDFFDHRWNLDRVEFANRRLISKWNLDGFKTTIHHAHNARKILTEAD